MENELHLDAKAGSHLAVDIYKGFEGGIEKLMELPSKARGNFKLACLGTAPGGNVLSEDISPEYALRLLEKVREENKGYAAAAENKSLRTVREENGMEIYEISFFFGYRPFTEEYFAEFKFPLGTYTR